MTYTTQDVLQLKQTTGMSILQCKKALAYAKEHDGVTPLGYLKSVSLAVSTPKFTFLERCQYFSKEN